MVPIHWAPYDAGLPAEFVVVLLHGGCFVGGNERSLNTLARALSAALRAPCCQLGFRTSCVRDTDADVDAGVRAARGAHPSAKLVLVGSSSGGYAAVRATARSAPHALVLLAPVLDPAARAHALRGTRMGAQLAAKQRAYFGTDTPPPAPHVLGCRTLVCTGTRDVRVPRAASLPWEVRAARACGDRVCTLAVDGAGHEVAFRPRAAVLSRLRAFL